MKRKPTTPRTIDVTDRPLLTPDGAELIAARIHDIEQRRLPELRPLLVEAERDERDVAEFERLLAEAARLQGLLNSAELIPVEAGGTDGRIDLGMRVHIALADGSSTWVRPVHPEESFLDDERISAESPMAVAIIGSRVGERVPVQAPSGVWICEILDVAPTVLQPA